ncbi:MAG: hypothetical protein LBR52_05240 [Prevotellaceae bacterium]|jgi:hypothetical protein|nr:hypothetical protein [Prevotellaceae bacterium]
MVSEKYNEAAKNLIKAIDIAIDVVRQYPPKGYESNHIAQFISTYLDIKKSIVNPDPQYMKMSSLKYKEEDVFIYFQEASGETVNEFWKRIKESGLPYKRENKMAKILKRKKIRNDIEYDYVIDTIVPLQQEGVLSKEDVSLLEQMMAQYEQKIR